MNLNELIEITYSFCLEIKKQLTSLLFFNRSGFYVISEYQHELLSKTRPTKTMSVSEKALLSAVAESNIVNMLLIYIKLSNFLFFLAYFVLIHSICS